MRTGLRYLTAVSIISANCGSRLLPRPTLPGLIRSFPNASAQAGCALSSLWPLKWKSPTSGVLMPCASRRSRMRGTAAADSSLLTVTRTSSDPARASALTCATVPSMSAVSVLVMDCTTMGEAPPMETEPTFTVRECRRDLMGPLYPERRAGSGGHDLALVARVPECRELDAPGRMPTPVRRRYLCPMRTDQAGLRRAAAAGGHPAARDESRGGRKRANPELSGAAIRDKSIDK